MRTASAFSGHDDIKATALAMARGGLTPQDIAHHLGCREQQVLAWLSTGPAGKEQRKFSEKGANHD